MGHSWPVCKGEGNILCWNAHYEVGSLPTVYQTDLISIYLFLHHVDKLGYIFPSSIWQKQHLRPFSVTHVYSHRIDASLPKWKVGSLKGGSTLFTAESIGLSCWTWFIMNPLPVIQEEIISVPSAKEGSHGKEKEPLIVWPKLRKEGWV